MTTREITAEQYDSYCALRDEIERLRESLFNAPTLAAKVAIRQKMSELGAKSRQVIGA